MRELILNGYIDEDVWYGDEITPDSLHSDLYGANNEYTDDVHIRLNSYGGSCNAAVRMYDDIRAYPGNVSITVSGTAASAATMLCMAADVLDMTPGSLFMIHDPSMMAYGNEHDMADAIEVLHACKDSILNMYEKRARVSRIDLSDMMTATCWMDANAAYERGFVDSIAEDPVKGPINSAADRESYERYAADRVEAWFERKRRQPGPKNTAKPDEDAVSADIRTRTVDNPVDIPVDSPVYNDSVVDEEESNTENSEERVSVSAADTKLEHLRY